MKIEIIEEALESYNKYRGSLVTAELISVEDNTFKVRFEGNFCSYCGMDEYFVDLIYEMEAKGVESKLLEVRPDSDSGFLAEYEVLDP